LDCDNCHQQRSNDLAHRHDLCTINPMKLAERTRLDTASAVFWAIACVPIAVVLTTPHFVVQDGGLHLSSAVALRGLIGDWFPSLLGWRPVLSPNMTVEAVLAGLTSIVSADVALKLVVVIGLIGYAVAIAALMRAAGLPLYLGIPLLAFEMHYFVMLGFFGFVWAVPLSLGAVAVVLRNPVAPQRVPLTALLVAAWFTHIVPALVATITICLVVMVAHLADREPPIKAFVATCRLLAVPVSAITLLTAIWFFQTRTSELSQAHSMVDAAKSLLQFSSPLVSYAGVEKWLARALALAVFAVAAVVFANRVRDRTHLDRFDGLIASAATIGLFAVVMPEHTNSGAGYIGVRMTLFATIFLILWVCTQLPSLRVGARRAGTAMIVIGAVVAVAIPVVRAPVLHRLSAQAEQIESLAECLPKHSTLVQLNLDLGGTGSARGLVPMAEQTGLVTVPRQALDLGNESGWFPFYIWRYADVARADRYLEPGEHFDGVPPSLDLAAAMAHGLPLTAVIVYGRAVAPATVLSSPAVRTFDEDLESSFRLVRASTNGNAELWLRNDETPSC
jgi:hypothetical protein